MGERTRKHFRTAFYAREDVPNGNDETVVTLLMCRHFDADWEDVWSRVREYFEGRQIDLTELRRRWCRTFARLKAGRMPDCAEPSGSVFSEDSDTVCRQGVSSIVLNCTADSLLSSGQRDGDRETAIFP